MELILIRHPQTTYNASANRYCGRTDAPLSERGLEQMERLRTHFVSEKLTAVWSSPLSRARQCAEAIASSHGIEVHVSDYFIEYDFGKWEGLRSDEIAERDPGLWAGWNSAHPFAGPPGGEQPIDVYARVVRGLKEIVSQHSDGKVLLVTHDQVIRMLYTFFLGIPFFRWRQLGQPANGSLCRVSWNPSTGTWRLAAYNQRL